jgi:hypothetical protein
VRTKLLRHWPIAVGTLLPLVAVIELAGNAWTASLVPPPAGFEPARRLVAQGHRDGDLVLVYPDWMGEGRVALGQWLSLRDECRGDILDYPRVWELTLEGRQSPEVAGLPVEQSWSFDGLQLTLYQNTTFDRPVWRAYDDIGRAHVLVRMADGDQPCRYDPRAQHHNCGDQFGEPWVYVGPILLTDMEQQPRQCLWSHPTERGPIVVTFDGVPTGRRLTVHTALSYVGGRDMDKKPVHMEVDVDGQTVGTTIQSDGEPWKSWDFAVPRGAESRTVQFRVHTEFQGMRHYCFDAAMRGVP